MWTVAFRSGLYGEVLGTLSGPRARGACVPLLARPHRKTSQSGVIIARAAMGPGRLVTAGDAGGPLKARAALIRGLLDEAAGSGSIPLLAFADRGAPGRLLAGRGDYEMLDVFD